ncbi:MAG: hypothetical protein R2728_04960 [Chitinophagales bacterium]
MRILILIILINSSYSVLLAQMAKYADPTFVYSVKQFDEFIDRFNGTPSKDLANKVNENYPDRGKLIYSLFDDAYVSKNNTLVNEFIRDVTKVSNPKFFEYYEASWYAELKASYNYKGKKCTAVIRLKPEVYENLSSKWVVYQIEAEDIKPVFKENNSATFLSPASNETGFINLYAFIEEGIDPEAILPTNYNIDITSLFLKEIADGAITNFKIHENKYHVYQIDGWYFTVKDFIRNTSNSGWLINNIQKL